MTPKLFKASDVCELAKVQPYVLRSWEKEFPGIGVQKSTDNTRLYRQSDVDQVLRIKQLVFGEGLTVSGARRRLDDEAPASVKEAAAEADVAEMIETLGADARTKIARVREGLRAVHALLVKHPGAFVLEPLSAKPFPRRADTTGKASAGKSAAGKASSKVKPETKLRAVASRGKAVKRAEKPVTASFSRPGKKAPAKRRRANA